MHPLSFSSRSGFSTLVALGITGFLLVLVTWLVTLFLQEMKITRSIYDGIVTYAGAEGAFEYAMMKVRNHREGFQDAVGTGDPEYSILSGTNTRTRGLTIEYTMQTQSTSYSGEIEPTEHLVIPLFVGDDDLIGDNSKKPTLWNDTTLSNFMSFSTDSPENLGWNILALEKATGETFGLAGSGKITPETQGNNRRLFADCYDASGNKMVSCNGSEVERLEYMVENNIKVQEFLQSGSLTDFYLVIFNHTALPVKCELTATKPFALPMSHISATAHIGGRAAQTIVLTENKSRLFESLKYGIFSNN